MTVPRTPNYPLIYPKYRLLRTIRALLKGHCGVLVLPKALIDVASFRPQPDARFRDDGVYLLITSLVYGSGFWGFEVIGFRGF